MAQRKDSFRDRRWFQEQFNNMTAIATEPSRAEFYSSVRNDLELQCSNSFKKKRMQSVYGPIGALLDMLSWECMTRGAIAVVNGDTSGWHDIRKGFLYEAWSARFRHAFIDHDRCWDQNGNPASAALFEGREALTLCHAIAMRDDECAHGFGRHLLATFERTGGGDKVYFYTMPFYPFVLKLYSVWIGRDLAFRTDVAQPLGRYQHIFDYWNSPSDLAAALLDICDLHCDEAVETGGCPAFAYHPYNVFPVEVMCLLRIRQSLGLETPPIVHPLLESRLLFPPVTTPIVEDALLGRVIDRFRSDIPDGKECW